MANNDDISISRPELKHSPPDIPAAHAQDDTAHNVLSCNDRKGTCAEGISAPAHAPEQCLPGFVLQRLLGAQGGVTIRTFGKRFVDDFVNVIRRGSGHAYMSKLLTRPFLAL